MKKRVLAVLFVFLILSLSLVLSQDNTTNNGTVTVGSSSTTSDKINNGYKCLSDSIDQRGCSSLTLDEQIFSMLATGKCRSEVLSASTNNCWPSSSCNVKTTAQAILGISDSDGAEEWILTQTAIPTDLIWYLQIESTQATTCSITYDGSAKSVNIGEDKRISSSAGACLTLDANGYWLRVSENCFNKEFQISCNQGFLTSLLYKEKTSPTIYIPENTNSASAEGSTTEKINSLCLKQGTTCNYEATLWGAMALNKKGHDISPFIPYLTSQSDDNNPLIPESFLYLLTGSTDFYSSLISKQKSSQFWDESGNKFYDTSVALLSLQNEEPTEKQNSKNWLLEVQESDGCWKTVKDTAFILYSAFPRNLPPSGLDDDCEDAGNYCSTSIQCSEAGGERLSGFSCPGVQICCTKPAQQAICLNTEGAKVCNENENCFGSKLPNTGDLSFGQTCCLGECRPIPISEKNDCELGNGICRSSCLSGEESNSLSCTFSSDVCCIKSSPKGGMNWTLISILAILILLVVLAIIFRDKLKLWWMRVTHKGKSSGTPASSQRPSGFPPRPGPAPRRIMPPGVVRPPSGPRPIQRRNDEMNEVLNKLKQMGK